MEPPIPKAESASSCSSCRESLAALLAAAAVGLGAMGAHALKETLAARPGALVNWHTAAWYHLVHAVVLWVLARRTGCGARAAWWLFLGGIVLFSGSIYLLSTTSWRWLGPVTPVGGTCLIAGWIVLALCARRLGMATGSRT